MFALVLAFLAPIAEPATTLESRIAPLAKAHKGKVGIAVKNLKTGESFYMNENETKPTASLIKLPVMVETYWQASEGKVKFDTKLTLTKDDKVPGSGILTNHFSDGATFPLKDAVRLMIVFSDNTATNMVLDQIGIPSTNARMDKLGLKETRIQSKSFKRETSVDMERSKKYGLGSTTPKEMIQLLEMIDAGKVVSPEACKEMLKILKACEDKTMIARFLPAGMELAQKTGAVSDTRTSAGIAYTKAGPVALCIMTTENADTRWAKDNAGELLLANIAKEVYDHFGVPEKK
jgi:beta-lactamase class A